MDFERICSAFSRFGAGAAGITAACALMLVTDVVWVTACAIWNPPPRRSRRFVARDMPVLNAVQSIEITGYFSTKQELGAKPATHRALAVPSARNRGNRRFPVEQTLRGRYRASARHSAV